ncbi:hypothetical protein [Streptomyces sp. URMC 124]|uniref:hypothetical protein n=1 Tax=Streptomyces sp. URMC 124 TaxID=3423405 RepID=UPI003F1B9CE1
MGARASAGPRGKPSAQRGDREQHEADLADALDQLLRRTRAAAGKPPKRRGRKSPLTAPGHTAVLEGLAAGPPAPRQSAVPDDGQPKEPETAPHTARGGMAGPAEDERTAQSGPVPGKGWDESLDDLAAAHTTATVMDGPEEAGAGASPAGAGAGGYELWDAEAEAEQW